MPKEPVVGVKIKAQDGATPVINRTAAAADGRLSPAFARAGRQAQSLTARVRNMRVNLGGLGGVFGGLTGKIGAFLGIGGMLNGVFLTMLGKRSLEKADELGKFSRQIGMSTQALQEYRYAAERAGAGQKNFDKAIEKFNKNRGDLKAGTGALYMMLKRVSPALAEQMRQSKDSSEAFLLMVDAINKLPDADRKAALAQAAFGKGGNKIIRMAEGGRAALEKLAAEQRKFGQLSGDDTKAAEDAADAITDLKSSAGGLVDRITADLLPALTPLINQTSAWINANRQVISKDLVEFIKNIGSTAKESWPEIKRIAGTFLDLFDATTKFLDNDTPGHIAAIDGSVRGFEINRLERIGKAFSYVADALGLIADGVNLVGDFGKYFNQGLIQPLARTAAAATGAPDTRDTLALLDEYGNIPAGGSVQLPSKFTDRKYKHVQQGGKTYIITDQAATADAMRFEAGRSRINTPAEAAPAAPPVSAADAEAAARAAALQAAYQSPQVEFTPAQQITGPTVEKAAQQPLNGKIVIDLKTDKGTKRIVAPLRNGSVNANTNVNLRDPRYERNMGGM